MDTPQLNTSRSEIILKESELVIKLPFVRSHGSQNGREAG